MTTTPVRPRSQRLLAAAALTVLLAGGAAACSGSGSDDAKATTTTTRASTTTTETAKGPDDTIDEVPTVTTDPGDRTTTTTEAKDDGDRSKQAYIDAFVEGFDSSEDLIPAKQSECVGEKLIDVIGFDAIKASGLTPEEFGKGNGDDFPESLGIDKDKANEMYDQFDACDVNLGDAFVKALSSEGSLSATEKACLSDKITDDTLRASFVASFLGTDTEDDPLDAASACVGGGADTPTVDSVAPMTPSTVG